MGTIYLDAYMNASAFMRIVVGSVSTVTRRSITNFQVNSVSTIIIYNIMITKKLYKH